MTELNNISTISTSNSPVARIVMGRVRVIHVLQTLFTTTVFSVGVFVVSLWGIGREVWVSRVFQNTPSMTDMSAVVRFYVMAFIDTRVIVQALSLLTIGAFVWFVYSAVTMLQQASLGSASRFRSQ